MEVACTQCGKTQNVRPARAKTYRFCSYACRGQWRKENFTGAANPNWKGGVGTKACLHCGKEFSHPIRSVQETRKFCSKPCADAGGFRYSGDAHPSWRGGNSRRRDGRHAKWARSVISRDKATCRECGAVGVELHAHHVKSWRDYAELRYDVGNGLTLCAPCHWNIHSAETANGVNSGEALPGNAGGNPEPSIGRKPVEGVTTRGRSYRRWEGECAQCGTFLSKRLSDVKHNKRVFCSKSCSGKFNRNCLRK